MTAAVAVERVELHQVAVPLRSPFRGASVTVTEREVILVRVVGGGASGWGECGPVPGYSADDIGGAWDALAGAVPTLVGSPPTPEALPGLSLTAAAACSQAGADLAARLAGAPLWRHVGGASAAVVAGASVGLQSDRDALVARVGVEVGAGYRHVKCKVVPGRALDELTAVRRTYPNLSLSADANASFDRASLDEIRALDDLALAYLEQPLAADDIDGHVQLTREMATPIVLDESAARPGWREALAGRGSAIGVTVKPGRLPWPDVRATAASAGADYRLRVGGMLELGIGRAHAVAAATLAGFDLPSDLSPTGRYLAADVVSGVAFLDGALRPGEHPGLGVEIDRDALAAHTRRKLIVLR